VTKISSGVLPALQWPSRPGAFSLPASFPGTGVLGVGSGTGPCTVAVQPIPRVRVKGAPSVQAPKAALSVQRGQTNPDNHMTGVYAVGAGAVGPPNRPQHREPA
jgi:hypothetical protein